MTYGCRGAFAAGPALMARHHDREGPHRVGPRPG